MSSLPVRPLPPPRSSPSSRWVTWRGCLDTGPPQGEVFVGRGVVLGGGAVALYAWRMVV
jgi:hypothetical protein